MPVDRIEYCTVCDRVLLPEHDVQRDLEGNGAHAACLETVEIDDEEEER